MPITFQCPHCELSLTVKDHFAGRTGPCPKCKNKITVPGAAEETAKGPPPAGPAGPNGEAASPAPAAPDFEDQAAALLGDEAEQEKGEVGVIEMECPYCFEPIQFPADLAGKREPCPECRHILKVPEPEGKQKAVDWSKANRLPSGARVAEPEPEGAWGTADRSMAHKESLQQAGVLPTRKTRWTRGMIALLVGLPVALLLLLGAGAWTFWSWWQAGQREEAVAGALARADAKDARDLTPPMRALLHVAGSEYYRQAGDDVQARDHLGKALGKLVASQGKADLARDTVLIDLLPSFVALGGKGLEDGDQRKGWARTQSSLQAGLLAIDDPRVRRLALREVGRALLDAGEARRVQALATLLFSDPKRPDHADGLATAGLLLLGAGDKQLAKQIADSALAPYDGKKKPALRPHVVALAVALGRKPPKPGKGLTEKEADQVGRALGLAYAGRWDQAREVARKVVSPRVRLEALLGLAEVAHATGAGSADVEAALDLAEGELKGRFSNVEDGWLAMRLVDLGLQAGLAPDKLAPVARAIPDNARPLRGRAQLLLFRARLASAEEVVGKEEAEKVDPETAWHAQARLELARHNVRHDSGWASQARSWEEPYGTFGSLGAALAEQGSS
jgi:hypothetical protein